MALPNIEGLTTAELDKLRSLIDARKETLHQQHVAEFRERIQKEAEAAGLSLRDVLDPPKRRAGSKRKPAAPKYASTDGSQIWSGRGRKPAFVEQHLAGGGQLDDLLIRA